MTQGKRESATQLESKQITFGTLLHDFRIGKEISQFDLAVNIKRAPSDISRWEKGTRKPPSDRATVISIANALKLSVPDKNRFLQAAGFEIPLSEMGVDLANPAIMKIVDVISSTKMPPDRLKAFEKDVIDFVEIWNKYQVSDSKPVEREQNEGYGKVDQEFSNFIEAFRIPLRYKLGKRCKHQGEFQEAIKWYQQALGSAERIGNQNWAAEINSCLGDVYRDMNNSNARTYYNKAASIFENELNDKLNSIRNRRKIVSADLVMGTKIAGSEALKKLDECRQELKSLLLNMPMRASRQQVQEELCRTLYFTGWAYSIDRQAQIGIEVRQEGVDLANELKNEYLITQGYRYLGDDYDNIDDLVRAEENYRTAWKHCEKIENQRRREREQSSIHRGLGTILAKQDQRREEAKAEFNSSLIYNSDNRLEAMNLNKYGFFLLSSKDISYAIDVLNRARNLFITIGNEYYVITATMNLVEAYCKKGDLVEAKREAAVALSEARKSEPTRLVIPALEKSVYVTFLSEDFRGALDEVKEFGELCSQIQGTNGLDGIKRALTGRVVDLIEQKYYVKAIEWASSLLNCFIGSNDPKEEDFRRSLVDARFRASTLLERDKKMER